MKLEVTIKYRDDGEETYICSDFPYVADWVTIYLEDYKRKTIPREAISSIDTRFIDEDPTPTA